MATSKPKLRSHIHNSYDYFISKFYDSEPALYEVSVRSLLPMVEKVEADAESTGVLGDGFRYHIDQVKYVLNRISELDKQHAFRGNQDIYIFGDALKHRFEEFLQIIDEVDAGDRY